MRFANVAIPSPIRGTLTYSVPEGLSLRVGMRVEVPFRNRRSIGLVMGTAQEIPADASSKSIKEVHEVLDEAPTMSEGVIELIGWMSAYYMTPIGEVLRASLPARLLRIDAPRTTRPGRPIEMSPVGRSRVPLNADQGAALERIMRSDSNCRTFLLNGVTGSGKTEVYLALFEEIARSGRQGLLMVPEIGLTSQLTGMAAARFGERVAVYHSGLTDAQRHEQWLRMKAGDVDVVIGTRSAVFAPLERLGAIVVDEEHDSSYKQDEGFVYHGRDSAVMRAHIEGVPVVLGSATPSLESVLNARRGKYEMLSLPSRIGEAVMPSIEVVDMRKASNHERAHGTSGKRREFISLTPRLYEAMGETLARGEQAMLFLGRRGFSSIHCESCGEAIRCPNCNIALTAHVRNDCEELVCHYCDYGMRMPGRCPSCDGRALAPIGSGTQRLEAEITDFFPTARIARLDSDMATSPKARHRIFAGMREGSIDILVGTQMITKGHDFPSVTLVGVVCADQSLHLPDFRAAERTFQLLTQVAGRAGRSHRPGRVIVQTYEPGHPSLEFSCSHDFEAFASHELGLRESLCYPPFTRLANMRFSSLDLKLASEGAARAAEILRGDPNAHGLRILGPAPAPLEKLRGRYRWHLLIKAPNAQTISRLVVSSIGKIEGILPRKVRLSVDIDPTNLL